MRKIHRVAILSAMLLWTVVATAQSPAGVGTGSNRDRIQVPTRPAPLFTGEQGKQRTAIRFDPATSTVTIKLLVQDPAGYFVPGLHPDNFAVYENGVRQKNASVEIEHAPVTLAIVMEHGGRYKGLNRISSEEVLRAGSQLLDELGRQDKVAVWEYADSAQQVADFSTGHDRLEQIFMDSNVPDSSEIDFYDALVTTAAAMKSVTGRKALVVITSGVDTFSKTDYTHALDAVRASGTPVYIVDIAPDLRENAATYMDLAPYRSLDWKKTENRLQEIAAISGGRMYRESNIMDLTAVYDDLMENLRMRYVIVYRSTSTAPLDVARTVRVELVDPKTNGPLEIVDANGKVVQSRVIVENSYVPSASVPSAEST